MVSVLADETAQYAARMTMSLSMPLISVEQINITNITDATVTRRQLNLVQYQHMQRSLVTSNGNCISNHYIAYYTTYCIPTRTPLQVQLLLLPPSPPDRRLLPGPLPPVSLHPPLLVTQAAFHRRILRLFRATYQLL